MCPNSSNFRQYLVTIIVNLSSLNYGILVGWPSPVQPLLQSKTNPAIGNKPLTDDMVAWVGSLTYLGATLGSLFWAPVANKLGRKKTAICIILPFITAWSLVCFTESFISLCIARIIGGLGNAGAVINAPMYVAETCKPELKSSLGTFLMIIACLGALHSYVFGSILSFKVFNLLNWVVSIVSLFITLGLPESPVFHIKFQQMSRARKSLIWLRNYREDNAQHMILLQKDIQLLESTFLNLNRPSKIKDIFIPTTRNAMLIGIALISALQFNGIAVVTLNSVYIFKSALDPVEGENLPAPNSETALQTALSITEFHTRKKVVPNDKLHNAPSSDQVERSPMIPYQNNESAIQNLYNASQTTKVSSNTSSEFFKDKSTYSKPLSESSINISPAHISAIIIATLQVLSGLCSVYLVRSIRRKILLVSSHSIMAMSLLILGLYYQLKYAGVSWTSSIQWVPVGSLSVYIIAYMSSVGPVTYIVLAEIFPAETRNVCMGIVMLYQQILMFILIKTFPTIRSVVGLQGCMWGYASITISFAIFISCVVPETKDKAFQEIVAMMQFKKAFRTKEHTDEAYD